VGFALVAAGFAALFFAAPWDRGWLRALGTAITGIPPPEEQAARSRRACSASRQASSPCA
jgi:hypothetical protein